MTYAEKLKDSRWWNRKREILDLAENCCADCGEKFPDHEIDVHHLIYLRGREPWDYPDELLMPLCRDCHFQRQVSQEELQIEVARISRHLNWCQIYEITKALRLQSGGSYRPICDVISSFDLVRK